MAAQYGVPLLGSLPPVSYTHLDVYKRQLEWSPDALAVPDKQAVFATASAAQVREPVHTRSINSSRKHVDGLAPLVEKLAAAGFFS